MSTDAPVSSDPNLITDTGEKVEENDIWPIINVSQGALGNEHVTHAQGALAHGRRCLHASNYNLAIDGSTDDHPGLVAAIADLANIPSVGELYLQPGTYKVNGPLVFPANSRLIGERVHLDFTTATGLTDNSLMTFLGRTNEALPAHVGNYTAGNDTWNIPAHNLNVGDVLLVWDTNASSFSAYRSSYQTQERLTVSEIIDADNFRTREEAIFDWPQGASVSWFRYYQDTPVIEGDINLYGPLAASDAHYGILMQNVIYPRITGIKVQGVDRTAVRFDNVYGLVMSDCTLSKDLDDLNSQNPPGFSYGVELRGSQDCTLSKCILHGDRHGFATGGTGLNVNARLENCTLTGKKQNAADFHGNTILSAINDCYIRSGISMGGDLNTVANCYIKARGTQYAIRTVEMKGASFQFTDNVIDQDVAPAAIQTVNNMQFETDGGTFRVNGLHVIRRKTAPSWIYWAKTDLDGYGATSVIDYEFSDITYEGPDSTPTNFAIELQHGDSAVQNSATPAGSIRISDCHFPGGIFLNWYTDCSITNTEVDDSNQYGIRCTNMTGISRVGDGTTVHEWQDNYYGVSLDADTTAGNTGRATLLAANDLFLLGDHSRGIQFDNASLAIMDNVTFTQLLSPFQINIGSEVDEFRGSRYYIPDLAQVNHAGTKHYLDVRGTGHPEGNLIASRSSHYTRLDGTEEVLYVKESGDGNTGWVIVNGTVTEWHTINTGAGGTGTVTPITLLPAGCILENVVVHVGEDFNGNQDHFVDVGDATTINKYIDRTDLGDYTAGQQHAMLGGTTNPQKQPEYIAAQTQLNVTWTNNNVATTGQITVAVTYTRQ